MVEANREPRNIPPRWHSQALEALDQAVPITHRDGVGTYNDIRSWYVISRMDKKLLDKLLRNRPLVRSLRTYMELDWLSTLGKRATAKEEGFLGYVNSLIEGHREEAREGLDPDAAELRVIKAIRRDFQSDPFTVSQSTS